MRKVAVEMIRGLEGFGEVLTVGEFFGKKVKCPLCGSGQRNYFEEEEYKCGICGTGYVLEVVEEQQQGE